MRTLRSAGLALLCFVFSSAVYAQAGHLTAGRWSIAIMPAAVVASRLS